MRKGEAVMKGRGKGANEEGGSSDESKRKKGPVRRGKQ
jgi:hypothetical protein